MIGLHKTQSIPENKNINLFSLLVKDFNWTLKHTFYKISPTTERVAQKYLVY